ncbi:MAG TPA: NAD(P)H-dependent oxidoreductase [Acidobacteriaceae bacterium]|jgi:FMN-dependent NADH-azoreductase|nr:NAD(P)H-dependent oxidoreductase [Acidobacteriaceae bacterium]
MPTLLQLDSSPRSASVSSELTKQFADTWKTKHPGGTHIHRNTAASNLPFVDEALIAAYYTPEDKLTPEQKQHLALSDKLIAELLAADTIVIGLPMWNFGVPASFKAWIDLVARAGKTFRYGPEGPKGLLKPETKVVVVAARGGFYSGDSPMNTFDQQEPGLRTILGFLGLRDIHFVYAENQGRPDLAPESKALAAEAIVKYLA